MQLPTATILTLVLIMSPAITEAGDKSKNSHLIHEVRGGVLAHDVDNLWSGFSRESGTDINVEVSFKPNAQIFGGTIRPALGASINTSGDTSKVYLDGRWQYAFSGGPFLSVGLGVAYHNGEKHLISAKRKALGSNVLFHIPLEVGYYLDEKNSVSIYFDHVSNAYTQTENEGLDTLGVRYGYKF